ncbi:uncharacterized protein CTRU02_202327 [Colletotrichum truncatum]|uniref:Uncharacterized protein n=1 Tax=Colletotrichum truncatum TaxID=5467 RepID=A0ACC3ZJX4_COLTU|nr:uncharacterized protein CTRU02_01488 [Colletotrichum truncatum]KAF6799809.1 hypothetical protein CTRU02_01488 [Colletotrichum truncatum]
MVYIKQAVVLAAASLSSVTQAVAVRDYSGLDQHVGRDAPLPSVPAVPENRRVKRQVAGGFIASSPTNNCGQATAFNLNSFGQLEANGLIISTNPGTPFIPLRPTVPQGSITVTFSLTDGALTWSNPAFFGGRAGFCQDTAGQVWATFADPAVAYPANCVPVRLGPVVASSCPSGPSSSSSTGPITRTPTGIPGTIPTPTPAVVNGTLTLRPGLYTEANFMTPAGAMCRIVTESWVFGDTTLLPPRTRTV